MENIVRAIYISKTLYFTSGVIINTKLFKSTK